MSLAAALALPLETDAGTPLPGRELIVFLAFCVILATLVLQGLTLPLVIRMLGLEDDGVSEREGRRRVSMPQTPPSRASRSSRSRIG